MVKMFKSYKDLPVTCVCTEPIEMVNKTGLWRANKPIIDYSKCNKCFICWKYCPDVSIEIVEEQPKINYEFCKGCGICANECPKKAITMVIED